jgi:hypothetical protein
MHCCALLMCDFLNRELDIRHKEDPKSVKNNNNNKKGGGGLLCIFYFKVPQDGKETGFINLEILC